MTISNEPGSYNPASDGTNETDEEPANLQDNGECPPTCWVSHLSPTSLSSSPRALPSKLSSSLSASEQATGVKTLYETLAPWQTRVLCIEPGSDAEPVTCRLLVGNINAWDGLGVVENASARDIEFEALSYQWGNPVFSESVKVNGIRFPVTTSLYSALQQLRRSTPRYLWVDAICINQHDNIEKSVQVRRMFVIYRKARNVIAWIPGWTKDKTSILKATLAHSMARSHRAECQVNLAHLYKLLQQAYWPDLLRRTWIRQEFFAANNIAFQYGDLEVSWDEHRTIGTVVKRLRSMVNAAPHPYERIDAKSLRFPSRATKSLIPPAQASIAINQNMNPWTPNNAISLLEALASSSSFQVSDHRDLVYGVIGLTRVLTDTQGYEVRQADQVLTIDYTKTVSQVYQSVVHYLIRTTRSLAILDFAGFRSDRHDIPSWTPDWRFFDSELARSRVSRATDSWIYGTIDMPNWNEIPRLWMPNIREMTRGSSLHTQGCILAHIQGVDDNTNVWKPLVSPSVADRYEQEFKISWPKIPPGPGTPRYFLQTFPVLLEDHRRIFQDRYKDKPWEFPLADGVAHSVLPSEACRQLVAFLQEEMLEHWISDIKMHRQSIGPDLPFPANNMVFPVTSAALSPRGAAEQDIIALIQGSPYPFVLRSCGKGRYYLVGRALFPLWFEHRPQKKDRWSATKSVSDYSSIAWKTVLGKRELLGEMDSFELI